jgi:hypothetical protein
MTTLKNLDLVSIAIGQKSPPEPVAGGREQVGEVIRGGPKGVPTREPKCRFSVGFFSFQEQQALRVPIETCGQSENRSLVGNPVRISYRCTVL